MDDWRQQPNFMMPWIYVTDFGTARQATHSSVKMVKISLLQQLLMLLLDSKNHENLNFWHLSSERWWMYDKSNTFSRHNWIYLINSGTTDQTGVKTGHTDRQTGHDNVITLRPTRQREGWKGCNWRDGSGSEIMGARISVRKIVTDYHGFEDFPIRIHRAA